MISHQILIDYFSDQSPEDLLMTEALGRARDDSPFVPDPPGALEELLADYESSQQR